MPCNCLSNIFVARLDSLGNLTALKSGSCADSISRAKGIKISSDNDGNVYILGSFNRLVLDTFHISNNGSIYDDGFIAKLDTSWQFQWAKNLNNTPQDFTDLKLNDDGEIFVSGKKGWTWGCRGFTQKFSKNTTLLWKKEITGACYGDCARSTAIETNERNTYNIGVIDFGPNCSQLSRHVFFVAKYDSTGSLSFYDTLLLGYGAPSYYMRYDIIKMSSNEFIVAGTMKGSLKIGSDSLISTDVTVFIAKFSDSGHLTLTDEKVDDPIFKISPNPSSGIFSIWMNSDGPKRMTLYDIVGSTLFSKSVMEENLKLDMSSQPKGMYFLEIVSRDIRTVKKIILE